MFSEEGAVPAKTLRQGLVAVFTEHSKEACLSGASEWEGELRSCWLFIVRTVACTPSDKEGFGGLGKERLCLT